MTVPLPMADSKYYHHHRCQTFHLKFSYPLGFQYSLCQSFLLYEYLSTINCYLTFKILFFEMTNRSTLLGLQPFHLPCPVEQVYFQQMQNGLEFLFGIFVGQHLTKSSNSRIAHYYIGSWPHRGILTVSTWKHPEWSLLTVVSRSGWLHQL